MSVTFMKMDFSICDHKVGFPKYSHIIITHELSMYLTSSYNQP